MDSIGASSISRDKAVGDSGSVTPGRTPANGEAAFDCSGGRLSVPRSLATDCELTRPTDITGSLPTTNQSKRMEIRGPLEQ